MSKKCESYGAISNIYDSINSEVDYAAWADFVEACFERFLPKKPDLVLDLACGTGSMTLELAKRGYDMIGVDASPDMLSRAYERKLESEIQKDALFLLQDMRHFELYGTVGAVTCCLDSVNYLVGDGELGECFWCVHNYLDPDGLFLFDVNSPYKFKNVYGENTYVFEEDDCGGESFCTWQNFFDEKSGLCDFYLTVFEKNEDGTYDRYDERQCERCYDEKSIKDTLSACGFELLGIYSDLDFSAPGAESERWYIVARCKK